ncbi:MAG: DEAD/DEAH box helicase [Myxococcales bacterium]
MRCRKGEPSRERRSRVRFRSVSSAPAVLVEAIRKAAPAGIWSAGVKLSRADAVAVESQSDEEVVLRVKAPGRPVAPTVVLLPGELDWDCDCAGRVRPCEHIVAAAISLSQAGQSGGGTLPTAAATWARIAYRFARGDGGLRLTRVLVRGDGAGSMTEAPLDVTLSVFRNRPEAADLHLEESDLRADLLLETGARAVLPPTKLDALLAVLIGARQVTLDGRPVVIAEELLRPRAVVAERQGSPKDDAANGAAAFDRGANRVGGRGEGGDLLITIMRDPRITEVIAPGVALAGDAIHRLAELELTGAYLQHLPQVRVVPPAGMGELATKILPELANRMLVEVRTRRVPPIVRDVPPRMVLKLEQVGAGLNVLPTLVYGQPATVRIDDGRMTHLGGAVPVRDEVAERRLVTKLRDELNLIPGRRATFEGADAAQFADKLRRWRGDMVGDAARLVGGKARLVPQLNVDARPSSPGGVPDVRFTLTFKVEGAEPLPGGKRDQTATVDAAAVLRAWQEGFGLVPLDGGGWASLPKDFLAKHGQHLSDLMAARAADGRVANHALPALAALCAHLEHPAPPGLDRLATLAAGFERLPPAPLPADLTATLRPYQRQAADWLAFLRSAGLGGILADDMGLGKTLEALCAVTAPALIVCPTSVLANWRSEIARFRPGLKVSLYHGPGRQLDDKADVTLTSYAILRLDAERLTARSWATVILDEAQAIKNPDSQAARAAYALSAELRIALTGTPLENRLEELWSLTHFTNRGLLGGRRAFDDRYGRPIAEGESGAAQALRDRLRPFLLRRLKREVAPELPPRTDAVLRITLDERERGIYDAVRAASRAEVVALLDGGGSVLAALEALLRLRQAACHPALVPGQQAASSSKVEALMEALTNAAADGHKALVFSQWTSLLDLIEPALQAAEIPFVRLDGSTRDRGAVVERFQGTGDPGQAGETDETGKTDPGGKVGKVGNGGLPDPSVMLLSLKAGGVGLNLTAADHVFLLDPWWNPATEDQAADRAHRIGQDRPVMVYRLVAVDTVEERILSLQEHKRRLAEAALGAGEAGGGLTRQDLLALLE